MSEDGVAPGELAAELRAAGLNGVDDSVLARSLYASDASLYRVEPRVVVTPRHVDEIDATLAVCRSLGDGLYEVRSNLSGNRIARVLFYVDVEGRMVLLHGFVKKTQKTPLADMELARKNKRLHEAEMKGRK